MLLVVEVIDALRFAWVWTVLLVGLITYNILRVSGLNYVVFDFYWFDYCWLFDKLL